MSQQTKLFPEDQQKVDTFLQQGINAVERKPFRPFRLLLILVSFVTGLSVFSVYLARLVGA